MIRKKFKLLTLIIMLSLLLLYFLFSVLLFTDTQAIVVSSAEHEVIRLGLSRGMTMYDGKDLASEEEYEALFRDAGIREDEFEKIAKLMLDRSVMVMALFLTSEGNDHLIERIKNETDLSVQRVPVWAERYEYYSGHNMPYFQRESLLHVLYWWR